MKGKGKHFVDRITLKATGLHTIMFHGILILTVLVFLQSMKETVYSIYYFNLVSLGIHPIALVLLIFLVPLATGPLAKKLGWRVLFVTAGAVMVSSRLPMGLGLVQPFHLIFSATALSSSSIIVSLFLALGRREKRFDGEVFSSQSFTASIVCALMLMVIFRIGGRGLDISIVPGAAGFLLSPLFSGLISIGLGFMLFCIQESPILDEVRIGDDGPEHTITGGAADSWAPALGFAGFLIVSSAILVDPNVVTAWTGEDFSISSSFTIFSMGLFVLSLLSGLPILVSLRRNFANPMGSIIGNAILIGGAFNIFYMGIDLKIIPGPFVWIALVDLWVIIDAILDPAPFAGEPIKIEKGGTTRVFGFPGKKRNRISPRHFGTMVAIAVGINFLFVVMISFALNWAFVPMGILFKDSIQLIMMGGVIVLALSGFSCSKGNIPEPNLEEKKQLTKIVGSPTAAAGEGGGHIGRGSSGSRRMRNLFMTLNISALVIILVSGGLSVLVQPKNIDETGLEIGDLLTVATFNIHHGYSNDGRIDATAHLEYLKEINADIVFLQEADSVLPNQGNFDPGEYIASNLGMHYFRGTRPGIGNPGTSILSRFPIEQREIVMIRSKSIQRIIVTCVADIGIMRLGLVGVHFGLEEGERMDQMEDLIGVLDSMEDLSLIIGGDFNTEPHEDMMAFLDPVSFGSGNVTSNGIYNSLSSGWHSTEKGNKEPDHPTFPAKGLDLEEAHIDYIFFSGDIEVIDAGIEDGRGASDHRPVWAKVEV